MTLLKSSFIVAGMSGGSGKSVATVGLIGALKKMGRVVPFKKGPDYIDAGWMSIAAGVPCYNLDPYLMSNESIATSYLQHGKGADFIVIEGNRGLYDGVNADGGYSTAELALQLDLPVLLVVNCAKVTRTVAAMVLGCRGMSPKLRLRGVILNEIATPRHESIVRQSVEKYSGLPVVGVIPRMKTDIFPMRHLGVTPYQESDATDQVVADLASLVEDNFDLGEIISLTRPGKKPETRGQRTEDREQGLVGQVTGGRWQGGKVKKQKSEIKIGVLRDAAFQFYYEENLEALQRLGAELIMINALHAAALPDDLQGLYIGGGFPETSVRSLADNKTFRESVRRAAEDGLPVYAECGGLIFLGRSFVIDGERFPLTGVFPVDFGLAKKPQAHGYSIFTVERGNPFYPVGTRVKGHEFRYSTVDQWDGGLDELCLNMERGTGFLGSRDGLQKNNVLALYTHVLDSGTPQWAAGMLAAGKEYSIK
jgi:cobyrinic acid a,c-diamide synthase